MKGPGHFKVTSMLVADVGESPMETTCVVDKFGMLVTSHVTNIKSSAPTSNTSHQHHNLAYYDVSDRC